MTTSSYMIDLWYDVWQLVRSNVGEFDEPLRSRLLAAVDAKATSIVLTQHEIAAVRLVLNIIEAHQPSRRNTASNWDASIEKSLRGKPVKVEAEPVKTSAVAEPVKPRQLSLLD